MFLVLGKAKSAGAAAAPGGRSGKGLDDPLRLEFYEKLPGPVGVRWNRSNRLLYAPLVTRKPGQSTGKEARGAG